MRGCQAETLCTALAAIWWPREASTGRGVVKVLDRLGLETAPFLTRRKLPPLSGYSNEHGRFQPDFSSGGGRFESILIC